MPRKAWSELTDQQRNVLEAAMDLMNGGLDGEEILGCYQVISDYVTNSTLDDESEPGS
jgi:hypothetical protein